MCEKDERKGIIILFVFYVLGFGKMLYVNCSLRERMWFFVKL